MTRTLRASIALYCAPLTSLSMLSTISEDRVFYRVIVDDNTLTGYDDLPLPVGRPVRQAPIFATYEYRGEQVRAALVTRGLSLAAEARTLRVVVAQTRLGLESVSSRITATAMAVGAVFFVMATALSILAARSALLPLDRLAAALSRRGPNDLRPVAAAVPSELAPLVAGLNNVLMRLRAALGRSEDLIAEAAHRVRTPLATVRTQTEVIHRQMEQPKNRRALRDMIRAVDESSRSAGQLLEHAMVTVRSDQLEQRDIDPAELLRDTVDRLSPTADLRDICIRLALPENPARVRGDPVLLQSAVRNLLDNAIKYSPDETDIDIRLTLEDERCLIVIRDQGRGFGNTADVLRLKRRFLRGENVGDVVGSGLGLTIAEDVARAHGGHLEFAPNPEGPGVCVTLILPLS